MRRRNPTESSGVGRREIDGQAREGEKAGRNSSQCGKRKEFLGKGATL